MKKYLLLFLLLFATISSFSQVKFEKGFIIDMNNNKIECLIKNYDWIGVPDKIEYKLNDNSTILELAAEKINAVQIYETNHYFKRFIFEVDVNKDEAEKLQKVNGLLRVLVEGRANLYEYQGNTYYYQLDGDAIKRLKFKKFVNNTGKYQEDLSYRVQLFENLKCDEKASQNLRKIKYKNEALSGFFVDYSNCMNAEVENFRKKRTKSEFHLKAFAGINSYSLKRNLNVVRRTLTAESQGANFLIGLELEAVLPFNNKKWSLFVAPIYQSQKEENKKEFDQLFGGYRGTLNTKNSYSYIELPLGVRHYFFLNEKSKLYTDVAFGYIFPLSTSEENIFVETHPYPALEFDQNEKKKTFYRIGLGYTFNNKYDVFLNYYPVKNLFQSTANGSISLSVGCRVF